MPIKSLAIATYIMLLYGMSLQFHDLHMIFFPTLGAFGFICITRSMTDLRWIITISFGAVLISFISTTLHAIHPGMLTLLATTLITIWLIHRFKWNAPPILAIALIPYFSQSSTYWTIPLSVSAALLGLIAVIVILYALEGTALFRMPVAKAKSQASVDTEAQL